MISPDVLKKHIKLLSPIPTGILPRGRLKNAVECILFDIYGTLFISGSGDIGDAKTPLAENKGLEKLIDEYGINLSLPDLINKYIMEIENSHKILKSKNIKYPEVNIIKIWSRILPEMDPDRIKAFAVEFEMITNPVWPMPYLEEALSFCRKKNIKTGIISNAQFYTPLLFRLFLGKNPGELGFDPDLTIFSYKEGCAKPSLSLFLKAKKNLKSKNISEKSALYVGNDMLKDIMPAQKAGFRTALFAGDKRSLRLRKKDMRCQNINPDIILTGLDQLVKKL